MRRFVPVVFLVLAAACTSQADSTTTTTDTDTAATTTTISSAREGLVPDPAAIREAAETGSITRLEADRYLTLASWGEFTSIPLEFMKSDPGEVEWEHSASSRLVEQWDELDVVARGELLGTVDGLGEFVERPGFQGLRAQAESCVPTAVDVWICAGASIEDAPVPGLPLNASAEAVRPWVRDAAVEAWPLFHGLFGDAPSLIKVYLANLHADGGYTYGVVPEEQPEEAAGGICHAYVDVLVAGETDEAIVHIDDPEVPDGVPLEEQLKATVAHELFHCFQRSASIPFDATLWEGSATWAEHHVYPEANTELPWMETWVSDPDKPFATRLYDTSFGFLFAEQRGASGVGAVMDVLHAGSIAALGPAFEELWHAVSVSAWNQEPAEVLVNDGGALIPATVGDLGTLPITAEAEETMEFSLPMFSRDLQTFEFLGGTTEGELAGFARLALDLSQVPSDVRISAIPETTEGWMEPVLLTGSEWVFCRVAIGPCNDADPETILPYTRVVVIATNVDNGVETFSLPWDTYNPHLDGEWVRIDGPLMTVPGATAPYSIVGTSLAFDEPVLQMSEDTEGYAVVNADPGWECTFAGSYRVGADPAYGPPGRGDVDGTITFDGEGEGETFTNNCVFTSDSGFDTVVSGLHIPVAASPTFTIGFEIRSYDTLWVYAFERIYVYERVS